MKTIGKFVTSVTTWDEVVEGQYAIVGSPETVREQLEANLERLGTGNLLGLFQLGTLPSDLTRNSLELFAREIMPKLHERFPSTSPAMATTGGVQ